MYAMAGVPYTVGREDNSLYNETRNGIADPREIDRDPGETADLDVEEVTDGVPSGERGDGAPAEPQQPASGEEEEATQ